MADAFHPQANCKPVTPQAYVTCDISALMVSIKPNEIKGFWRLKSLTGGVGFEPRYVNSIAEVDL